MELECGWYPLLIKWFQHTVNQNMVKWSQGKLNSWNDAHHKVLWSFLKKKAREQNLLLHLPLSQKTKRKDTCTSQGWFHSSKTQQMHRSLLGSLLKMPSAGMQMHLGILILTSLLAPQMSGSMVPWLLMVTLMETLIIMMSQLYSLCPYP